MSLIVIFGAVLILLVVGLGVLVTNWPRPDTRLDQHPSVSDLIREERETADYWSRWQ